MTNRHTPWLIGAVALVGVGLVLTAVVRPDPAPAYDWPERGQAALRVGSGEVLASGPQRPAPIASVTKIMTALLVLERFPIDGADGFTLEVDAEDEEDTRRRASRGESVLAVRTGEALTERQALLALLLPSANNVADLLAEHVAGSDGAFVVTMNARAAELGLADTRYVDASGIDPDNRSTAVDQVRLATVAMANPTFAWLVRQPYADLPVAGRVESTDELLGRDGFVGVKTGSHRAAGGCFVFAVQREVDGERRLIIGAVLGQRGPNLLDAAFDTTVALTDSVR